MAGYVLKLRGCTPEPLGNYLKGLGVFRLIAEQADPLARAWWKDGILWLHTKWSEHDVLDFFTCGIGGEKNPIYGPTPIFAPWGGRPGFYEDGNEKAKQRLNLLRSLAEPGRFTRAAQAIKATDHVLDSHGWISLSKKKRFEQKADIVAAMRNVWHDCSLDWFDACVSLEEEDTAFGFLYGTGGNEGSADITNNFWEMVEETIGLETPESGGRDLLRAALFATPRVGGTSKTAGQHFPLAAGSANCGQNFEGSSAANPWDVILMMEGAVPFAGATTRRLSHEGKGKSAFPFMIDHLALGEAATSISDEAKQDGRVVRCRAEFWMPLWRSPASFGDVRALISEGRLQRQSGERTVHTLHAIEAIKTLGVSRGVETFQRVALFERRGKGYYLASSLGFHTTSRSSQSLVTQLAEIGTFCQQAYENLREGPGMPGRILRARQRLHVALAAFMERDEQSASPNGDDVLDVLVCVAGLEKEVSVLSERARILKPCPTLSAAWLPESGSGPEYDIALAISSIASWGTTPERNEPAVQSTRGNLLPVTRGGTLWDWDDEARSCVWSRNAPLEMNLAAVLRRRLVDARRGIGEGLPFCSPYGAGFDSLFAFWNGELDEQRIANLVCGLSLIGGTECEGLSLGADAPNSDPTPDLHTPAVWFGPDDEPQTQVRAVRWRGRELIGTVELEAALSLPRIYHLLKLCFVGGRLPCRPVEGAIRPRSGDEPFPPLCMDVVTLLDAGRLGEAVQVAARRLRAKGYPAIVRNSDFLAMNFNAAQCRRLLSMLLIPVRQPGMLAALAIKPERAT